MGIWLAAWRLPALPGLALIAGLRRGLRGGLPGLLGLVMLGLVGLGFGAGQAWASGNTGASGETGGTVAVTFDDLPGYTILPDETYVERLNADLLAGLRRHHMPATGFVIEGKLDDLVRARQIRVLRRWRDAGMGLGNHTYSHESPNTIGAAAYTADILKGEPVTRALLAARHKPLVWFRPPYLETEPNAAAHQEIYDWLAAHHYRMAPVTIDADDWEFAEPYDDAIAHHKDARRDAIRAEYLDYTEAMIGWSQAAARALFGRDIALVMMLHDSRLNADCLDDLAAMLKRRGLKPVSLETAMRDPAYQTPDSYAGSDGIEWLERWSLSLGKPLPWTGYRDMPRDIVEDYKRVDGDTN